MGSQRGGEATVSTVECGAATLNGGCCTRLVGPGMRCPYHPQNGRNGTADVGLPPEPCGCVNPLPITDITAEVRCLKCGRHPAGKELRPDAGEVTRTHAEDSPPALARVRIPQGAGAGWARSVPASAELSSTTERTK
jgi:hypothetical protein